MRLPVDLLALLLVLSAGLAYRNHRFMKLPMAVALPVRVGAGILILIALDALHPVLGLKLAIRDLISRIDFAAAPLGFHAFLLVADPARRSGSCGYRSHQESSARTRAC